MGYIYIYYATYKLVFVGFRVWLFKTRAVWQDQTGKRRSTFSYDEVHRLEVLALGCRVFLQTRGPFGASP